MSKKIKMFGATPSPYTHKMLSIFRYKHIGYEAFMGDAAGRLKKMNIDPALASSVFVTTITDVIGFLSFLGLGSFYFLN